MLYEHYHWDISEASYKAYCFFYVPFFFFLSLVPFLALFSHFLLFFTFFSLPSSSFLALAFPFFPFTSCFALCVPFCFWFVVLLFFWFCDCCRLSFAFAFLTCMLSKSTVTEHDFDSVWFGSSKCNWRSAVMSNHVALGQTTDGLKSIWNLE